MFVGANDRPNNDFVMIHNDRVRNAGPVRLRARALALHHYLLSLQSGQMMPMDEVAERVFPLDSRESVRRAARELRAAGFLVLHTERDARGRFAKHYQVFHSPQPATFMQVTPDAGFPAAGNTADKNRRLRTGPVPVKPKSRSNPQVKSAARRGSEQDLPVTPLPRRGGAGLTQARTDPRAVA